MGTATAPSTTLPTRSVLAGHKQGPLHPKVRVRKADAMEANFEIARRGPGEPIPDRDARRVQGMRRLTRDRLNHCGLSSMCDSAALIVSELVTNAIQHSGGTQIALRMQLQDDLLYLAVESGAAGKPAVREADNDAEHGRGLQLVDYVVVALDGIWGASEDGATVWCLLPAAGDDQ